MSDRDAPTRESMPPWDPSLVDAARELEGPDPDAEARIFARLERSITANAPPDGPVSKGGPAAAPAASLAERLAAAARARALGWLAAFSLGALGGSLVTYRLVSQQPREPSAVRAPLEHARPAESTPSVRASALPEGQSAQAPSRGATGVDAANAASTAAPSSGRAPRSTAAPRPQGAPDESGPGDLAAETDLIDMARSALARGNASAALDAVAQHARRFPRGQLAEDRESLAVQALVSLDRGDDARRRAALFYRRWPTGLYRARVDAAVALLR